MDDFNCNSIFKKDFFIGGASLFTSSLAFCSIGKYMKIEGVSFLSQLGIFTITTVAQSAIHAYSQKAEETLDENLNFLSWFKNHIVQAISPVVLIGIAVKNSHFKSVALTTSIISSGYFAINYRLISHKPLIADQRFIEQRRLLKQKLLEDNLPNRPTIIRNARYLPLKDCTTLTSLPKKLRVIGSLDLKGCTGLVTMPEVLQILDHSEEEKSNLNLEGCSSITSLPVGLEISGDLNLKGCTSLRSLPEGLRVGGNVNAKGCTNLRELANRVTVGGNLNIEDCTSLRVFPNDLSVEGDINARGCTSLEALPQKLGGFKVNINAKGCTSLTTIPEGFKTQGDLILEGCTSIRRLPSGLNIGKTLNLRNCLNLLSIPEDLVSRNIVLTVCIGLKEIPSGINPPGYIHLDECTGLTKLHRNQFDASLSIEGCTGIKELPKQLHINGGLFIKNIDTISMPEELNIGRRLWLENIRQISLPDGLKIGGDLHLENIETCTLPRGLKVGGSLWLNKLNITELPEDLKHLGGLHISNCPHLKTLPEDLVVEGNVFIGGGTPELKVLPRGLRVKGDLVIREESSVTELSENLRVDGDLKADSTSIEKLGENTHIGGELNLNDAVGLENIPEHMTVGWNVLLRGHCRLTRIPDWMKRLPHRADGKEIIIGLRNTSIPPQDIEELKQAYAGRADIRIGYARPAFMGDAFFRRDLNPFDAHREQLELLEIAHIERPTEEQIRKAFKSLSLRNHPDKGGSTEKQQQLEAARNEILKVIEINGLD